jgi:hypothetical protein
VGYCRSTASMPLSNLTAFITLGGTTVKEIHIIFGLGTIKIQVAMADTTLANADWMELVKTKVFHATVTAIWPSSHQILVKKLFC